jgi:hypothetical protein
VGKVSRAFGGLNEKQILNRKEGEDELVKIDYYVGRPWVNLYIESRHVEIDVRLYVFSFVSVAGLSWVVVK